jgi:putative ABC transport system permease protein
MFNNTDFKIAFRSLWRKRAFSFLNIAGLAVGIAASLLIFLVIKNELSYDRYHTNKDRIYRVVSTLTSRSNGEVSGYQSAVPGPLPDAMRHDFPALEQVATVFGLGRAQIYVPGKDLSDEKRFNEKDGLFFAEPALFKIFDYNWMVGNAEGLKDLNTVVINQSLAENFFGDYNNAMGKTIQLWSYRIPLRVVGVFKDLPLNTDVPVRLAASYATMVKLNANDMFLKKDWGSVYGGMDCFVLASAKQRTEVLQMQLPAFVKKYYQEDADKRPTITNLSFQPLKEMHLDKRFETYGAMGLSKTELWSLGLIGLFLLLVACINFVNLATAQSVSRAKEIGVRKVLGSTRRQLLGQFLNETALITVFSILLGCLLAAVTLPYLSIVMRKPIALNIQDYPAVAGFLLLTGAIVTLLSGFYPAMVLSGFNPIAAIKSKITTRTIGGISLRRGLVVLQFLIAQLLVIGTLVVVKQMDYFRKRPLGFEKEAIVLLNLPSDDQYKPKYAYLKEQLLQTPGVADVSLCMDAPSSGGGWYTDVYFDTNPERESFMTNHQFGDAAYFSTFKLKLTTGRLPYASDTVRELVVNEAMVKKLGLKSSADIIGKTIGSTSNIKYPIVGVVKDFNNKSLREEIEPIVISSSFKSYNFIAVRLNPAKMKAALPAVQKTFTGVFPTYMYDCTFLDDRIENYYVTEAITAQLFKVFAFLAIFISCLGLYGLISFMAVQKTKEVGIRKVLGASVQSIVYLFSKEFTILIGISFLIAAPLGYYFMQEWLANFHYHTNIGWGVFAMSVLISVVIAWCTVGYKAIGAALVNPVKSLKTE